MRGGLKHLFVACGGLHEFLTFFVSKVSSNLSYANWVAIWSRNCCTVVDPGATKNESFLCDGLGCWSKTLQVALSSSRYTISEGERKSEKVSDQSDEVKQL